MIFKLIYRKKDQDVKSPNGKIATLDSEDHMDALKASEEVTQQILRSQHEFGLDEAGESQILSKLHRICKMRFPNLNSQDLKSMIIKLVLLYFKT